MMEESFIDIVNSLERATDTIYQAYELLYELEVDGEKNTSMYGITLNLLHKAIWVESDVLSRLNKTFMVEDDLIYFRVLTTDKAAPDFEVRSCFISRKDKDDRSRSICILFSTLALPLLGYAI